jgi:hypothetical protein
MNKFQENNFLLEWVRLDNKEYIYQVLEFSKNLKFLINNY